MAGRIARLGWMALAAIGLLSIVFGAVYYALRAPPELDAYERITGMTWDQTLREMPGVSDYIGVIVGSQAQFMAGFGFLVVVLASVPYRRGERWSWYALWSVPVLLIVLGIRVASAGGSGWILIAVLLGVALLGLALPYHSFSRRAEERRQPVES